MQDAIVALEEKQNLQDRLKAGNQETQIISFNVPPMSEYVDGITFLNTMMISSFSSGTNRFLQSFLHTSHSLVT